MTLCTLRAATVLSRDCRADFGRPLTKKVMSHSRDGPGVTTPSRTNMVPLTGVWNPPPSVTPPLKSPRNHFSYRFTYFLGAILGNENSAQSFSDRSFWKSLRVVDVRAFGSWTSTPKPLFFQDFVCPARSFRPGHPRERPPDVRGMSVPKISSLGCFFVAEISFCRRPTLKITLDSRRRDGK